MAIDELLYGLIGAVLAALSVYYLEERSKQHSYELNSIYKPLREEFIGIQHTGRGRLEVGDRYPWSQSETYRKIKKRGDLLPRAFKGLGDEIRTLEEMNEKMGDKASELWNAVDLALKNAMDEVEKGNPDLKIEPMTIDEGLRYSVKDWLFCPIYFGQTGRAMEFLDMQAEVWKYHDKAPALRKMMPAIRARAEEEITQKRIEFFDLRQRFFDRLNLILSGLDRSIRSSGRKKYKKSGSDRKGKKTGWTR